MSKKDKAVRKKKSVKKESEVERLKDQLARALADYDNLRKRVDKEREDFRRLASFTLITKLLPVFDMLEEAQEHLQDSGVAIIIKELVEVFEEEGIERIGAGEGVKFDENLHEVVEVVDQSTSKKTKGDGIVNELVSGWKYKDGLVIRPAKVKVAKSKRK